MVVRFLHHRMFPLLVSIVVAVLFFLYAFLTFSTSNPLVARDSNTADIIDSPDGNYWFDLDDTPSDLLLVHVKVQFPGWGNQSSQGALKVSGVKYKSIQDPKNDDRICLDRLTAYTFHDYAYVNLPSILPPCAKVFGDIKDGVTWLALEGDWSTTEVPILYSQSPNTFWYPYDTLDIPISFSAQYHIERNGKTIVKAESTPLIEVIGDSLSSEWDTTAYVQELSRESGGIYYPDKMLMIHLERPLRAYPETK